MVFAGMVLARAAALYEKRGGRGLYANQTQFYEPAVGGDIIRCDVVVSQEGAFYPFVEVPDYLIAMSQRAYDRYLAGTDRGTTFILDEDAVEAMPGRAHYGVPASRRAEEMGRGSSANMIMLGALIELSSILSAESVMQAIAKASPSNKSAINKKAFSEGMNIGRAILESEIVEESG